MSIEIVKKRKTEPQCPSQHKQLVPLRVTGLERIPGNLTENIDKQIQVGDVIMLLPNAWSRTEAIFNCTKAALVDRRLNECVRCVRAYEVERVVLCNDSEPAPIE